MVKWIDKREEEQKIFLEATHEAGGGFDSKMGHIKDINGNSYFSCSVSSRYKSIA